MLSTTLRNAVTPLHEKSDEIGSWFGMEGTERIVFRSFADHDARRASRDASRCDACTSVAPRRRLAVKYGTWARRAMVIHCESLLYGYDDRLRLFRGGRASCLALTKIGDRFVTASGDVTKNLPIASRIIH